jgi:streptogramin lyase
MLLSAGCDGLFFADGDDAVGIQPQGGFFFLVDNDTQRILMLDRHLSEVRSWSFSTFTAETFVQGLTSDESTLWVSVAGDADALYQLDLSEGPEPVVLTTLPAPPDGRGTVRDIAWDDGLLWVLNGGSVTYSTPPELFRVDPISGEILDRHELPSAEPRGLCRVDANEDVYGQGASVGLYYTDKDEDRVYRFATDRSVWFEAFDAPVPPRGMPAGIFYIFPSGIVFDGETFWTINSSDEADHLFRLDESGGELQRIDLPYESPGAVAWSSRNLAAPAPPAVTEVFPNVATRGDARSVTVSGTAFREGADLEVSFGVGVTTDSLRFENGEELTVHITIADDAPYGPRDVTVVNPDGQQGVGEGLFRVVEGDDPSLGSLWLADLNGGTVRRYSISEQSWEEVYDSTPISQASQQGLTFDDEKLWISFSLPDRVVVRVDTTGGVLTLDRDLAARSTGTVRGLSWNGQDLWVANQSSSTPEWNVIDRIDPVSGETLETIPAPRSEGGMRGTVWADGELYANDKDADAVYVWLPDEERWEEAFSAPIPPGGDEDVVFPTGMTWDGLSFWMCNSSGEYDYIFQISPDGTVLGTIEVPDRGPAQPTGLVYTPPVQR